MHEGMTVADRYTVRRLLGRGGLAEVWEAQDRKLRRPVAVKFMTGVARHPEAVARFSRESEVLAALRHPGIVTVFDAGTIRGEFGGQLPYMVMELVAGRPWSEASAVPVFGTAAAVADALAHAHAAKIAHRDVKPANVMIAENGAPVLIDFGIARDDNASSATVTATGNGFGTPRYMAPEQVAGKRGSAASDIYALGLVVLEKLTGSADPRTLDAVPPKIPAPTAAVLRRMTATAEADRPSAAESARQLRTLAEQSGATESSEPPATVTAARRPRPPVQRPSRPDSPPPVSPAGPPRVRRGRPLIAAACVSALALLGWGAWQLAPEATPRTGARASSAPTAVTSATASASCSADPEPAAAPPAPSTIRVNVYNATSRPGLASAVAAQLKDRGFTIGRSGNSPDGKAVGIPAIVVAGPAGQAGATVVSTEIDGSLTKTDQRSDDSVDLVIGDGFTGIRTLDQAARALQTATGKRGPTAHC